ncbi:MAG: 4-hydroxy-tetrahydrodipicolinate synthase [Francisellaceae bacterium]|nr:4-hydroxy-tetrahydrodipicolinate synthase [Francisellaceae bacterium]MBT6207955.1 4-hydroxy-tetrahydrodipicolinate synthase [Francisellaceae bacterium]MBT6538121.1 4-hydroxy-tetrahydrodipicolinate synthase [Francisellaceae bacterium]
MEHLIGSFVAIVAPMHESGDLDLPSFNKLLHMHKSVGVAGIVVNGTTGESVTLTKAEQNKLLSIAVAELKGSNTLVIAGTGTNNTVTTILETQEAFALGADACLLIAPYYNRPTQKGLYQHFLKVANSVAGPLILYNHPGRTGVDLLPETVSSLSEHKNIVAIKDACGNVERFIELSAKCVPSFSLLSGDDSIACNAIGAGAHGVVSVAANIIPAQMQNLVEHSIQKSNDAYDFNEVLQPLFQALNIEVNPIPIKWVMHKLCLIGPGIRMPLLPLSSQYHDQLTSVLDDLGVEEQMKDLVSIV